MSMSQIELIANNRPGPHAEQVGVRYSVLDSAVADFKAKMARLFELEDRAAHCTCEASHAALLFEPRDRDDGKYAPQMFARIASCLADEKRLMGEGLVTTAGQRECL